MAERLLKIPTADFALTSKWKNYWAAGNVVVSEKPTISTTMKTFQYSLPSGEVIKSAKIWAKLGNPNSGASFVKVNGGSKAEKSGGYSIFPITLSGTSGSAIVTFSFKANGKKEADPKQHSGTMNFSGVYLEITYGDPEVKQAAAKKNDSDGFSVPPQAVCIYDQTDGEVYLFDGVTKLQHSLTMDIQEEPDSKKKDKYVNNARNNPDKVTIDVVMSDVYTGAGAIITKAEDLSAQQEKSRSAASAYLMNSMVKSTWTRSETAANTLHWLKEQRRLVSVITPQYVYVDMLIGSVTINQDENFPFGWEGQLVFQHAYEPKEEKKNNSRRDSDETQTIIDKATITTAVFGENKMPGGDSGSGKSARGSDTQKKVEQANKKSGSNAREKANITQYTK